MENTKRDKRFTLMLSAKEYEFLMREAAKNTLRTGKQTSTGQVLRTLAFQKSSAVFKPATEAAEMQAEAA
jgi:hypothetical protein